MKMSEQVPMTPALGHPPVCEEGLDDPDVVRVPATDVQHPGVVEPGHGAVLEQVPGQEEVRTVVRDINHVKVMKFPAFKTEVNSRRTVLRRCLSKLPH